MFSTLFSFFSFIEQVQWGRELSSKQAKVLWVWLFRSLGIRKTSSMTLEEALSGAFCQQSGCLSKYMSHGGSISLKCPSQLQAILSAKALSVYPSCLPGHLAGCLSGCCCCGWSWPPLSLYCSLSLTYYSHIATHVQPMDHSHNCPQPPPHIMSQLIEKITDELNLILGIR